MEVENLKSFENDVCLLNSAIIGLSTGLGVKLTPELGYFENCACEVWMFVYGKSTNNRHSVGKYNNTQTRARHDFCFTSMDASLNIPVHSKLKGQRNTIKFGSNTSLVPNLAPYSLSLKTILATRSL